MKQTDRNNDNAHRLSIDSKGMIRFAIIFNVDVLQYHRKCLLPHILSKMKFELINRNVFHTMLGAFYFFIVDMLKALVTLCQHS